MSAALYPAETNGDSATSFIPLTTAWPSSSGCASYFRLNGLNLVAYDPDYGIEIDTDVRCAPPAVTTVWNQEFLGGGYSDHTVVSLGPMTCPEHWSTVVTSVKDYSSTLAMCCPSGYYLTGGLHGSVAGGCLSDVSSGMTLTYASRAPFDSTAWKTATTTLSGRSTVRAVFMLGWNVKFHTASATSTRSRSTTTTRRPLFNTLTIVTATDTLSLPPRPTPVAPATNTPDDYYYCKYRSWRGKRP
ncbi:hypothetical protein BJY01DRAFT_254855 [Aspergillus pseudoustus]|uniref:Uncharacterized protein n=1 Tax=Aspergillus pseudoustus TaxID=1810923 RepID=A0ABR4IRH9_9EURO